MYLRLILKFSFSALVEPNPSACQEIHSSPAGPEAKCKTKFKETEIREETMHES